jgi:hypothetical protein
VLGTKQMPSNIFTEINLKRLRLLKNFPSCHSRAGGNPGVVHAKTGTHESILDSCFCKARPILDTGNEKTACFMQFFKGLRFKMVFEVRYHESA